jgi:hypothetical protein
LKFKKAADGKQVISGLSAFQIQPSWLKKTIPGFHAAGENAEHAETYEDALLFRVFRIFNTMASFWRAGTAIGARAPKSHNQNQSARIGAYENEHRERQGSSERQVVLPFARSLPLPVLLRSD